jgi:hypothetical protein
MSRHRHAFSRSNINARHYSFPPLCPASLSRFPMFPVSSPMLEHHVPPPLTAAGTNSTPLDGDDSLFNSTMFDGLDNMEEKE